MTILLILNKEKCYFIKDPTQYLKTNFLVIKKYINKYLNKGFIYPNISLAATPILLTKKLRGGI